MDKGTIREIFLRNGFTIKDGQTDLKPYVYAAAHELIALASATPSSKDAADEPAARVDRIISASGLAEVSVFLESALKVGTVLCAAPVHAVAAPSAEQAPAAARRAAERINAMHKGVVSVLSEIRAEHEASAAGAGSAPHAQAAPVYQVRVIEQSWAWTDASEEAYHTFSEKRRRILYAAPVPQEAEQADRKQN